MTNETTNMRKGLQTLSGRSAEKTTTTTKPTTTNKSTTTKPITTKKPTAKFATKSDHEAIRLRLLHEPNPLDKLAKQINRKIEKEKTLSEGDDFLNDVVDRRDRESFERFYEATIKDFSLNMSFERNHQNLYFSELSKKSGISIKKLETYEMGNCYFDFEHMCRIAYSLNVTLGVMFGGG